MNKLVTVDHRGGVALIYVDNPPVNALSVGVPEALVAAIGAAETDAAISAIIVLGAGRTFVAGADITTLEDAAWGKLDAAPAMHDVFARVEDSTKPVVMAIHGTALGGGLELAMAAHFRVAVADASLGQPEVNLGIIPGAEGTQRLPRLVGVAKAVDMCVSGRPLNAHDALAAGLIDAVITGDLADGAAAFARDVVRLGTPAIKTRDRRDRLGSAEANAAIFASGRELAAKIRRHQTAPPKAIDAIEAATTLEWNAGCRRERDLFFECVQSEQAKALIHVFFAERAVAKISDVTHDAPPRPVTTVAIVGAGTMGGGIAMACANAGLSVLLEDATDEALERGMAGVRRNYAASVSRGRITADAVDERMARIHPQSSFAGFEHADVVIEAVFESMDLKQRIFRELDTVLKPGCLFATNTSTLDIDRLASATSRPDDVVGLHFFSPAHVMRLVEVVRGQTTAPDAVATAMALAKRLGKIGVLVKNGPGFVGNRMMFPYMYETQFLVEDGATPAQVDKALTDFGMAMGMFAVDDMAGIDVAWRVRQELGHFRDPGVRTPLVQDRLYEMGRLGQKTGKGWYRYDEQRKATPDPDVVDLIRRTAAEAGVVSRTFTDHEIVERAIYALVNEGARALDEGLARRAADIDVIYVNGYGFPGWRGGPLFHADRAGLPSVLDRISAFHREFGARWAPAPLLARLVSEGRTFTDFDQSRKS